MSGMWRTGTIDSGVMLVRKCLKEWFRFGTFFFGWRISRYHTTSANTSFRPLKISFPSPSKHPKFATDRATRFQALQAPSELSFKAQLAVYVPVSKGGCFMKAAEKVRENRIRRVAARQRLRLERSRRREPASGGLWPISVDRYRQQHRGAGRRAAPVQRDTR